MSKSSFSIKKRLFIFALALTLLGGAVLGALYAKHLLGANQFRIDGLRLLVILVIVAFVAMGRVSLSRFEHEEAQVQQ